LLQKSRRKVSRKLQKLAKLRDPARRHRPESDRPPPAIAWSVARPREKAVE
jgi:hypothetical protein